MTMAVLIETVVSAEILALVATSKLWLRGYGIRDIGSG